ncbi:N-acetyltransferase [Paenibacillus sp. MMS20-IR301]|uniref:GNAT family N-acetyltransferase n=1 Tax=Paenibacillus sp. MMS20-IR301 TaxID=2895946 RepID=UPI0028E8B05C|nr:N-acetyltransferase [Paenibacillus sp. MMS20-IR301]WNS44185.1 N-acetyltransferase [Paenibacillus sp. MMS20-IR301]
MTANASAAMKVTVTDMRPEYNHEVGRLIAYGFQGKFRSLTKNRPDDLAVVFRQLLEQSAEGTCTKRVVALLGEEVVGTMSMKWHKDAAGGKAREAGVTEGTAREADMTAAGLVKLLETGGMRLSRRLLLLGALCCLNHNPVRGECYIADLAVHPRYQGMGIGGLLLHRAAQYMQGQPRLEYLSLHVSGRNTSAKGMYGRRGFRTQSEEHSLISKLLFGEESWEYMICGQ